MNKKGFTLIELVVVMAIFMFIIGAAIGITLSIIKQQKNTLAEMELLNEVGYIQEYMSKALRMATVDTNGGCLVDNSISKNYPGYTYLLALPNTNAYPSYDGIKFLNQSEETGMCSQTSTPCNISSDCSGTQTCNFIPTCEEFYLDNGVLEAAKGGEISELSDSSKFTINFIRFGIDGYNGCVTDAVGNPCPVGDQDPILASADLQPRVTVLMIISIKNDPDVPAMLLETTVSRRNINFSMP